MSLEARYRRLLRLYPRGHRECYGEEMIGVLLATAGPGRDRPSPADRFDIARSALALRLRSPGRPGGTGRRDAAAAVVVFGALLLAAAGAIQLTAWGVWVGWQDFPVWATATPMAARPVIWARVVVTGLAGRRRTAAALAATGLLVEIAHTTLWYAPSARPSAWLIVPAAVVAAAAGLLCTGTPARRPRAVGAGVVAAAVYFTDGFLGQAGFLAGLDPSFDTLRDLPPFLAVVALAAWCWWRQPAAVRGWSLVYGAPFAAVLLLPERLGGTAGPDPFAGFGPSAIIAPLVLVFTAGLVLGGRARRRPGAAA